MTELRRIASILSVVLLVVACSSGPGKTPETVTDTDTGDTDTGTTADYRLSPPAWLHGTWTSTDVPIVVRVTADNWIDNGVPPLDVQTQGYSLMTNESSSDTEYSFSYPYVKGAYKAVITYLVVKTATGITIQTAFDPAHPTLGLLSPVFEFTRSAE